MDARTGGAALVAAVVLAGAADALGAPRTVQFTYLLEVPAHVADGHLALFVPLLGNDDAQQVHRREITASLPGRIARDAREQNRFWHGTANVSGQAVTVRVDYRVTRHPLAGGDGAARFAPHYLGADRLVPVRHPAIEADLASLKLTDPSPLGQVRALAAHVAGQMALRRVGIGWGRGDAFWALTRNYGDSTDFHARFVALARAWGIPARMRFGVPLPDRDGSVGGYISWAEVFLEGTGWLPVDLLAGPAVGELPADRLAISVGRDLELGATGPQNFFVLPRVEVNGRPVHDFNVSWQVRDVTTELSATAR